MSNLAVVAFQDITQRKQSEAELVEYRQHLEMLVGKRTAELNATNSELDAANQGAAAAAGVAVGDRARQ